jgi:dihydroflavonol-4-reductase
MVTKNRRTKAQPSILVTGGTGFLGAHLLRYLVESGEKNIRVMASSIPEWVNELGIEGVQGSVTSREDIERALEGVSEVYHLAGMVSRDPKDSRRMFEIHVDGTRNLCEAAASGSVKSIVLVSTSGTIAVSDNAETLPDESYPPPLEIISRWPYYSSKLYQENVAIERFSGKGRRLSIVNPSLLLGPGDSRLSSTKIVLDFLSRKINAVPSGGLNFVDVRDVVPVLYNAMKQGQHKERYLVGAVNWSFEKFFGRLERLTKVNGPRLKLPSSITVNGSRMLHSLFSHWNMSSPVSPDEIEMAEHFWYLDSSKAKSRLNFSPRDPSDTLSDTVNFVRQKFFWNA